MSPMPGKHDSSVVERRTFPARPEEASPARHWVSSRARLHAVGAVEVGLLVTELFGNALRHGDLGDADEIEVALEHPPGHIRVEISHEGPVMAEGSAGIGFALLERLASRWGHDHDESRSVLSVWFEYRIPGAGTEIEDADDNTLLARAGVDESARREVFRRHLPMAESIAWRYRGKGVDVDDLRQVASMALMKAIQRFDPEAGSFAPFAASTVSGELKRHLRDKAWSVRVPRGLQEASLHVGRASRDITQRLGRTPMVADLVAETGLDEETVVEALAAGGAYRSVSLDAPLGDDPTAGSLLDKLGENDDGMALAERWQGVAAALRKLPDRQRRILYLRFYEDMTQSEIAEVIGVSQMHVSRLLRRALATLRDLSE